MIRRDALVWALLVPVAAFGSPAKIPPRVRAAYGDLLELAKYAEMVAREPQFAKQSGCPDDIGWVTWGIAKTDPWDHVFLLRCTPSLAIGSAGPDGVVGTSDDLWSDVPLAVLDANATCRAACTKLRSCKSDVLVGDSDRAGYCRPSCATDLGTYALLADTCLGLDRCEAGRCLAAAAPRDGRAASPNFVSCEEFARVASRAVRKPKAVLALQAECERGLSMPRHELACVADSKTAAELALCFLEVNRDGIRAILSK